LPVGNAENIRPDKYFASCAQGEHGWPRWFGQWALAKKFFQSRGLSEFRVK